MNSGPRIIWSGRMIRANRPNMSLKVTKRLMRATSHLKVIVAVHERSAQCDRTANAAGNANNFEQHLLNPLLGAVKEPVLVSLKSSNTSNQGHLPAMRAGLPAVAAVRSNLRRRPVLLLGNVVFMMNAVALPDPSHNVISELLDLHRNRQSLCLTQNSSELR